MPSATVSIVLRLSPQLYEQLRTVANRDDVPVSSVARRALFDLVHAQVPAPEPDGTLSPSLANEQDDVAEIDAAGEVLR